MVSQLDTYGSAPDRLISIAMLHSPTGRAWHTLRLGTWACTSLCHCAIVETEDIAFPFRAKDKNGFFFFYRPALALRLGFPSFSLPSRLSPGSLTTYLPVRDHRTPPGASG